MAIDNLAIDNLAKPSLKSRRPFWRAYVGLRHKEAGGCRLLEFHETIGLRH